MNDIKQRSFKTEDMPQDVLDALSTPLTQEEYDNGAAQTIPTPFNFKKELTTCINTTTKEYFEPLSQPYFWVIVAVALAGAMVYTVFL